MNKLMFVVVCFTIYLFGSSFFSETRNVNKKFKETFKETQEDNFYVLNDILTKEEKEKLIFSLNENNIEEKREIIRLASEEKSKEISQIGKLRREELKNEFQKYENLLGTLDKILFPLQIIATIVMFLVGLAIILLTGGRHQRKSNK